MDIEIVRLTDDHMQEVLAALSDAFDGNFDSQWFDWKHRSGPWGPSPAWVAADPEGLLGVRIFLPWRFQHGNREFRALRPCDTVTVPRARGRGVFRMLTEHALEQVRENVDFLFNTPNSQSKPGYLKMGFVEWSTVVQRIGLARPSPARLIEQPTSPPGPSTDIETVRSEQFLDWRYRTCPVYQYRTLGLAEAEEPNGIVIRARASRGGHIVVVDECWGGRKHVAALIRAACHEMRTPLVWINERSAASVPVSKTRGVTSVTRFDFAEAPTRPLLLTVGDVESVL